MTVVSIDTLVNPISYRFNIREIETVGKRTYKAIKGDLVFEVKASCQRQKTNLYKCDSKFVLYDKRTGKELYRQNLIEDTTVKLPTNNECGLILLNKFLSNLLKEEIVLEELGGTYIFNEKNKNLDDKIKRIADYYGIQVQRLKLSEECAEYCAALSKYSFFDALFHRKIKTAKEFQEKSDLICLALDNYERELADVLVLARQFEYYMSKNEILKKRIEEIMLEKVDRQLKRIGEEQND